MSVFKVHHANNYTVVSNSMLKDKNLSNSTKGLFCMILSLPAEWDFSEAGLASISKDGVTSIRTSLHQLEEFGYLERHRIYENGRVKDWEYNFYENPLNLGIINQEIINLEITDNKINNNKINNKSSKYIGKFSTANDFSSDSDSVDACSDNSLAKNDLNNYKPGAAPALQFKSNDKAFKNVTSYINTLNYSKEIKDSLYEWYTTQFPECSLTIGQLEARLKKLDGYSVDSILECINTANTNGWKSFYFKSSNSKSDYRIKQTASKMPSREELRSMINESVTF